MKKKIFFILVSFLLCFVYALPIGAANVSVTGVSVSLISTILTVGKTKTMVADILPSNATNKSVIWLSSNTAVAAVSSTGIVTAKSGGSATITCRTIDGNKTATCLVTVLVSAASVSVSPTSTTLTAGTIKTIIATVLPLNAANKSVMWLSSNTAVATVSSSGVVIGISVGSTTITCKTVDGNKIATCAVTVPTISVTGVSVSPISTILIVGKTKTIVADVSPSNATNKSVTWLSSNTGVATVSSTGVVLAKSDGNATITCKTVDGNKTATCLVTVAQPVTSVSLSQTSASLLVGTTKTIIATVLPSNATNKSVDWFSSDTDVAEVSNTGVVTAEMIGNATITCKTTDGDKTATCDITITDDLTVNEPKGTMFIQVGEKVWFRATSNSASKVTLKLDSGIPSTLTKSGTSFSVDWTPKDYDRYEALDVGGKYIGFKKYTIATNNNTTLSGDYAVLMLQKAAYQNVQPTLDWSSPTSTPFIAPATTKYNCLAYSVDLQNMWYDSNNGPSNSPTEITKFMLKQPPYNTRMGTVYTKTCAVTECPIVIYYDGGHFAKATSWNSDGTPKTIEYKLGKSELVKTSGYDVYTYHTYGSPVLYFK